MRETKNIVVVGLSRNQSSLPSGFVTIGAVTRIEKCHGIATNIMEDIDKEDYRKPSEDEGDIVFNQQEKGLQRWGLMA